MEKECGQLKELYDRQAEQLSRTSLKLQEKTSENESEIKNLKETIFELEDQVEQQRAIKLHNNQLIGDLECRWSRPRAMAQAQAAAVRGRGCLQFVTKPHTLELFLP